MVEYGGTKEFKKVILLNFYACVAMKLLPDMRAFCDCYVPLYLCFPRSILFVCERIHILIFVQVLLGHIVLTYQLLNFILIQLL